MTPEQSPLDSAHRDLGAKMVPFGGWEMPLEYATGTLAEHMACRSDSVVFDVSHLGSVRVEGADAFQRLQRVFTNDLARISPGRAQYTHLLAESDGSVLDDVIIWWHPAVSGRPDRFDVMPNASNTARVLEATEGVDTTHGRAVLAVQGPKAAQRLGDIWPEAAAVGRFRVAGLDWHGAACIVAGTGYTGERGVEIAVPADTALDLWNAISRAGVIPGGLGARDTLRLEAALPLHGHELGDGITPSQVGLGWVVGWDKLEFRGREALVAERSRGISRQLVGLSTEGRRPPRAGARILLGGEDRGEVTSGNYSPVLDHGIALGFLPPGTQPGTTVSLDVRGTLLPGRVVHTPFVTR